MSKIVFGAKVLTELGNLRQLGGKKNEYHLVTLDGRLYVLSVKQTAKIAFLVWMSF